MSDYSVTIPITIDAAMLIKDILDEQDQGHFHNFRVETDHPDGVHIIGSKLLMACIVERLSNG